MGRTSRVSEFHSRANSLKTDVKVPHSRNVYKGLHGFRAFAELVYNIHDNKSRARFEILRDRALGAAVLDSSTLLVRDFTILNY